MSLCLPACRWDVIIAREEHVDRAVADLGGHMTEGQRQKLRDKLLRYTRKPDRDLILAVAAERVAGFFCVIEQDDLPPQVPAETRNRLHGFACGNGLLVHSDCRRRGVGASLQRRAEQWACARGRSGFWLSTHRQADWYRRHFAYEEAGRVVVKGIERTIMAKGF